MSLLLKILPIFPLIDKELVKETVTNSENSGLFNWVVIEYFYRSFIEVTLFYILCHFRHQSKKSVLDVLKRIGMTFGLILWNYAGLSVNLFSPTSKNFDNSKHMFCDLMFYSFRLFGDILLILRFINSVKKAKNTNEKNFKFYILVIEGLLFKWFIDGDSFASYFLPDDNSKIDKNFRLFSFGGIFMKAYFLLVEWNSISISVSPIEWNFFSITTTVSSIGLGFSILYENYMENFSTIVGLFSKFRNNYRRLFSELRNNYRTKIYYKWIQFILIWSSVLDLALVTIHVFNIPIIKNFYNLLMGINKLFIQGTLPLIPLWRVCYEASRGKTDLSVLYLLYGYEEEESDDKIEKDEKDIISSP